MKATAQQWTAGSSTEPSSNAEIWLYRVYRWSIAVSCGDLIRSLDLTWKREFTHHAAITTLIILAVVAPLCGGLSARARKRGLTYSTGGDDYSFSWSALCLVAGTIIGLCIPALRG